MKTSHTLLTRDRAETLPQSSLGWRRANQRFNLTPALEGPVRLVTAGAG